MGLGINSSFINCNHQPTPISVTQTLNTTSDLHSLMINMIKDQVQECYLRTGWLAVSVGFQECVDWYEEHAFAQT